MTSELPNTKDLTQEFPASPRQKLAGYVIAARTLDKCRAGLAGKLGEYHFDCPLDNVFFDFTGIKATEFQQFVALGSTDEQVAEWIEKNAKPHSKIEIIRWNNEWRDKHISELPDEAQEFLETYIPQVIPEGRVVHCWFDVYDIEEKRM